MLNETFDLSTGEMTINGPQKDLFDDFSMEPNDMDFEIVEVVPKKPSIKEITASHYTQLLELTASFNADTSPGRSTRLAIRETNSGKFVTEELFKIMWLQEDLPLHEALRRAVLKVKGNLESDDGEESDEDKIETNWHV